MQHFHNFGSGFASFNHLKNLPLNTLKIDKTYVDTICDSNKNCEIVKAMIAMGKAMDMTVIAEGVESQNQADLLAELGCDVLQGFLFNRPLIGSNMEAVLRQANEIPFQGIKSSASHFIERWFQ